MASSFFERLPMGLREMRASLASDGCPLDCTELKDVVRYYRARGARAPFQIVRFGGMELAVAPNQARLAAHVGAAAVRMVQHWGIVGVPTLAGRAEIVSGGSVPVELVRRILAALPATRWLDPPGRDWFSLAGRKSGLGEELDKVLASKRDVEVAELHSALARSFPAVMDAPRPVFERYLVEVAGCAIEDALVRREQVGPLDALTEPETRLVDILAAAGGQLDPSSLRRRASEAGLSDATLTRLLRFSPLVLRTSSDDVRLLGAARADARRPGPQQPSVPAPAAASRRPCASPPRPAGFHRR